VTSGRNIAWPYVIDKIKESPIFGFGREAMITTGIYQRILDDTDQDESFPHPHNAYLQLLLDDGLFGFLLVIPFYFVVLRLGFRLLLDRADPLYEAVGGVCVALVLALMVAGMGGETFYPREGAVGMWAAIGLLLRVAVERQKAVEENMRLFGESETSSDEPGTDVEASHIPA
jgi:O-antigen ligase